MSKLPLSWAKGILQVVGRPKPDLLVKYAEDAPEARELTSGVLICETRSGYPKWAHFLCPRCGEHIQLSIAGAGEWRLTVDWLRRPTIRPSVWQTGSCGAHFFVNAGLIRWYRE